MSSTTLLQASNEWMRRPSDERFVSLDDMFNHCQKVRDESRSLVVANRKVRLLPEEDNKGLVVVGPDGNTPYSMTHWSFGQVAELAESPALYLRTLPSPIAADCVNYKMQYVRNIEDVGLLLRQNSHNSLTAATGPRYGRIWDAEIIAELIRRFGDGVTGPWRVPGEFGVDVTVNKSNTTLFASDRNMFVFLADEKNRIELPNRRSSSLRSGDGRCRKCEMLPTLSRGEARA